MHSKKEVRMLAAMDQLVKWLKHKERRNTNLFIFILLLVLILALRGLCVKC